MVDRTTELASSESLQIMQSVYTAAIAVCTSMILDSPKSPRATHGTSPKTTRCWDDEPMPNMFCIWNTGKPRRIRSMVLQVGWENCLGCFFFSALDCHHLDLGCSPPWCFECSQIANRLDVDGVSTAGPSFRWWSWWPQEQKSLGLNLLNVLNVLRL